MASSVQKFFPPSHREPTRKDLELLLQGRGQRGPGSWAEACEEAHHSGGRRQVPPGRVAAGERRLGRAQAADESLWGAGRGTKAKDMFSIRTSATSACKPAANQGPQPCLAHSRITTRAHLHFSALQILKSFSLRAPSCPAHPLLHFTPASAAAAPSHSSQLASPAPPPRLSSLRVPRLQPHTLSRLQRPCPQIPTQRGKKNPHSQPHHRLACRARGPSTANKLPLLPTSRSKQIGRGRQEAEMHQTGQRPPAPALLPGGHFGCSAARLPCLRSVQHGAPRRSGVTHVSSSPSSTAAGWD